MKQLDLSGFAQDLALLPQTDPSDDPATGIVDGTLAQSLNNDFIAGQQRLLYTDPDAFYRTEGADAVAAVPTVLGQLQELRDQLLDTTVNDRQRRNLARSLDNHLIATRDNVARHAARQSLVWQNATAQNRLDLLRKQAGFDYADPGSIANYADAARSAALDQARIADLRTDSDQAAAMLSNAASSIWRSAIEGALAKDDTRPAIALHGLAGDSIAPADAAVLGRYIDGARERKIGRDYLANVVMPEDDPSAPLDLGKSLANLDAAHVAATAQNEADWPDNQSQRATNQHFIDVAFGRKKSAVVQAKADIDQALANWLNEPTSDGRPQTNLPPPSIWSRLGDQARKAVLAILARNAKGTSNDNTDQSSDSTPANVPSTAGASAPAMPVIEGIPGNLTADITSAGARAVALGEMGAAALTSLPFIAFPKTSEDSIVDLGNGLRARTGPGSLSASIERRINDGLLGSGIGATWKDAHVASFIGPDEHGRKTLFVDPDQLKARLGAEAADHILQMPGVVSAPQGLPTNVSPNSEMRIGISRDGGRTISFKEASRDEVQDYCPNYPYYWGIALRASKRARAAGIPNGRKFGQRVHRDAELKLKVDEVQRQLQAKGVLQMKPEAALRAGVSPSYDKGSVRIDVLEIHRNKGRLVACVYDFKTGEARFTDKKMTQYADETGQYVRKVFGTGYHTIVLLPVPVP